MSRTRRHPLPADPAPLLRIWSGVFDVDGAGCEGPAAPEDGAEILFDAARLLVRVAGEPVGFVQVPLDDGLLDQRLVWDCVERELGTAIAHKLHECGDATGEPPSDGDAATVPWWVAGSRATPVSVIVCTRDRADMLERCLDALRSVEHDDFEIVVVDNAPSSDATECLVAGLAGADPRLRYVREDRPGLSCARNRGVAAARAELVAFTDDDVRVDPLWVAALVRGFQRDPQVACVTGLVAGASLGAAAEQYFDARVSWSSSCEQRFFEAARGAGDSRLHPYAAGAFGTGATMAFRASLLRDMGGFDECLGAGSPAGGGEDLDAFLRVLLEGGRISYEPAALAWHEHRAALEALDRQMYDYGKGLSAYLCKHALSRRSAARMAGRARRGAPRLVRLSGRSRRAARGTAVARSAPLWEVIGSFAGPWAYLHGRQVAARTTRMS
jgi:O-antigen biosynthesis protein